MQQEKFDIVIAGAGLAGLTLAVQLAQRTFFQDKKILLIDRDTKEKNDRTWCFWATDEEPLPPVLFKTWESCRFFSENAEVPMRISPFKYRMIRGIDFYTWAKEQISQVPHIQIITANILAIDPATGMVSTSAGDFIGNRIFNSARTTLPLLPEAGAQYPLPPISQLAVQKKEKQYTWLLQHFKGWIIETPEPAFDPATVTFMDYRTKQQSETRFVYVLPFSPTRALVEFTVFSPALCAAEEYDVALQDYIRNQLNIRDYRVEDTEFGVIPMTDHPMGPQVDRRVVNIGTVGGFVKPSSGYAFKRTQRKMQAFIDGWEKTGAPNPALLQSPRAFRILDSIMLRVLGDRLLPGHILFTQIFRKLEAPLVFRFLDEDATFAETLRLLNAPPALPFLKAAWRQCRQFFHV
ncbi:MAG TPA: lycopene cyclase family protein [Saprospiraceae bacterium]|nr:lycopene cyclase family protein [Saprospiraceae bacterium]